jgi:hypothetical protein
MPQGMEALQLTEKGVTRSTQAPNRVPMAAKLE